MTPLGGDNYSVTIPESNYNNADLLKYYIVAEDGEGKFDYGFITELFTGVTPISIVKSVGGDGRLTYKGVYAKVNGVATVATGIFSTSSLNVYLQDVSDGINIFKSDAITDDAITITKGNNYTITGIIDQYHGKTEIIPDNSLTDIVDQGAGILPIPQILTISQLLSNPEVYENKLIRIQQTSKTTSGGFWPTIELTSYLNAEVTISDDNETNSMMLLIDKDTDIDGSSEPSWPVDVVGIFTQDDDYTPYLHNYQILPRSIDDFTTSVSVELTILLEGPYNLVSDEMSTSINNSVPKTSPFSENPRTIVNIPPDIVDWVLVELRTTETGVAVASHSALLHKDGRVVADNGTTNTIRLTADPGHYFIVVKHRNHLPIMSSSAINLTNE